MALGQPQDETIENPPMSVVAPWNMNIDPSTMSFDPKQYQDMMTVASHGPVVPPQASPGVERVDPGPAKESRPLLSAIESGYADKTVMSPVEEIRQGIAGGDPKSIEKGYRKLVDSLTGGMSFGDRFADYYYNHGQSAALAHKMAADVIASEWAQHANPGGPTAEETVRLGLIEPNELMANQQMQQYAHMIPAEPFQMDEQGMPKVSTQMRSTPAQPDQQSEISVNPNARLTPLQQNVAESRQKALQSGMAYKAALGQSRTDLNREKIETEKVKRELIPGQVTAQEDLHSLRQAQANLYTARGEWLKQLPDLRRELAGAPAFELDAVKRVHKAIESRQPISKGDWLVASRWLTKGSPVFGTNFLGQMYNKLTGEKEQKGKPFGWVGLPEPPNTSDDVLVEANEIDDDMFQQVGAFIKSLLSNVTLKSPEKPAAELPTPKTPEDAHKLKPGTHYRRPDGKEMVR